MELTTRDLVQAVKMSQAKPTSNSLTLKLKGVIFGTPTSYSKRDGTIGYNYKLINLENEVEISFGSSRVFKKGEQVEVLLVLTGFNAYEPKYVPAVSPATSSEVKK